MAEEKRTENVEEIFEETASPAAEEAGGIPEESAVEETSEANEASKIEELEAKAEESENRLLRLQADYENYRRRVKLDQEAAHKYRAQSLISEILPALDNFERALQIEAADESSKSLLQGMEMVYRQLIQALQSEGVEKIEALHQPFDPHLHQAVMQVEDSSYEPNTVLEELQKGYKLKDRVIRPAMVKVNQ
ncbi:nucleotide exchange factor GrpE [Bacillus lacus]|uniref:Protein GrpE n=1 Tax=Metabacillus lacus TaxID=1983721 RepID=A0A7X2IX66_9BACI|nr:nucleotide exchange factor GrpE [Metabacillus lacus]